MPADFSILQQPNFAQNAALGYQAGRQMAMQRRTDAALQGVDMERPETILPLLQADPQTGAALLGASTQIANQRRDTESRQAMATYLKTLPQMGGGDAGGGAANSTGSAGQPAAATPAAPASTAPGVASDGTITVTPQAPAQPDPATTARNNLIDSDPEQFLAIQKQIGAMGDAQRAQVADATNAMANTAQQALGLPVEQRKAFIATQAGLLAQHGVSTQQINDFDPSDQNLHAIVGQAVGVVKMLDQADKDRMFALDQEKFGEQQRHDRADESTSAGQLGVAQGRLGLEGKRLNLEQQGKIPGLLGGATIITGPPQRSIGGKTYYQIGTKWFDNPEGK